jgi:hypothetical protein
MKLAPTARPALAKLLRLLGSPVDGEALGAALALGRTLKRNGCDFHDLADIIEAPPIAPNGGNGRAGFGAHHRRNGYDDNVETEIPRREMVVICMRHLERFTDKERKFVRSMNSWRGEPSVKQLKWLVALFERVRWMS